MKKTFSLLLILFILAGLGLNVFADTDKFGGQFTLEEKVVQEYIAPVEAIPAVPEIPEISVWSAEELSNDLPDFLTSKIEIDGLNYTIKIFMKNLLLKSGTLEELEGEQSIKIKYKKDKFYTFNFKVTKTITQEFVPEVPEIPTVPEQPEIIDIIVTGYEYTDGEYKDCKVSFLPEIKKYRKIITAKGTEEEKIKYTRTTRDYKKLQNFIPFKPKTDLVWNYKNTWNPFDNEFLYKVENWNCPVVEEEKPEEPQQEEPKPEEPTQPEQEEEQQPAQPQEPEQKEENKTVLAGKEQLPKTGEESNILFVGIGIILILSGGVYLGISKFKLIKENE